MDKIIIIFAAILLLIIAIVILAVVLVQRNKKYKNFLYRYSVSLKKLLSLNVQYDFFNYKKINYKHVYDNRIFFESVSCQDYLLYQLQFNKYDVRKGIRGVKENRTKYYPYTKELSTIKCIGKYSSSFDGFNFKKLCKIESELFEENVIKPKMEYVIDVVLYCSKINGRIYGQKRKSFDEYQITDLLKKLDCRNGAFYTDREAWDALCRVERAKVSNKIRFAIYKRDGYRCCHCGSTRDLEIDHIKPIAKGGKSTYDNLQTLCKRCNKEKGDRY